MASGGTAQAVAWPPGEVRARSLRIIGRDHMLAPDTTSDQVAQVLVDWSRRNVERERRVRGAVDRPAEEGGQR